MPTRTQIAEAALHDQTQILPKAQVLIVFLAMSFALTFCFVDQNGIGVLLPSIARDLHAQSTVSWAGTSALIANTIFQVLYGRLSDLFGRKNIFISALILLALSDLACGLSVNSTMLYIFRGLSGVANGGITSLAMMIVSDIVTLQERGKYQGILGVSVGLGNAIGPLMASAFVLHTTWRGIFYLLAPTLAITVVVSWKYLPTNMPRLNLRETVAKIDFMGLIFGTLAVILLLIPVSEGGRTNMPWNSPVVIGMLTAGGVCLIVFLVVEWKWASLPMMPLDMFKEVSVAAMLAQSFLLGACYYSYLYFLPLYFQNVRGKSPLIAACLQLPLVGTQSPASVFGGLYMSKFNRYGEVIWGGFGIWTLGAGLLTTADRTTNFGLIALYLMLMGCGTGFCFQPTLVALQAHLPKSQRAVVTSNRNFLRSSGAAVGIAVSSAILANVLKSSLPPEVASVANSIFATPDLSQFSPDQRELIIDAYKDASRGVFIWCVPVIGIAFLLCFFIKDNGLVRKEEQEAASPLPEAEMPEDPEKGEIPSQIQEEHEEAEHSGSTEADEKRQSSLSINKSEEMGDMTKI